MAPGPPMGAGVCAEAPGRARRAAGSAWRGEDTAGAASCRQDPDIADSHGRRLLEIRTVSGVFVPLIGRLPGGVPEDELGHSHRPQAVREVPCGARVT